MLDNLSTFLREVSALQAQRRALAAETGKGDPKLPAELRVPFFKLLKAHSFLQDTNREDLWRASTLSAQEVHQRLVRCLVRVSPSWVAVKRGDIWYAGAHRVRGEKLSNLQGVDKVLLWNPRPNQFPKSADAGMPSLRCLCFFPLAPEQADRTEDVVIISDSTIDLPPFIYGLQCRIRKKCLRLLWLAMVPGAGASELTAAWAKAPTCHSGLTIVNLNDAMK